MGQSMTNYDLMLKEFYLPLVQETLNNEVLLKKYLEESEKQFSGRRVVFAVHATRNSGVGARSESSALPTAGQQGYKNAYVSAAYIYSRIDITGQVKAAGKTAFADALASEMEGAKTDLVFDLGRQSYGAGAGILAEFYASGSEGVGAAGASAALRNQYAQPGQPGARYIDAGKYVQFGTIASPSGAETGTTVSSVTIAQNSGTVYDTINVTSSRVITSSTGFFVFNVNAGGTGIEVKGLRAIVDNQTATNVFGLTGGFFNNSTIFNIDRNSVANWNAYVDQNSGTVRLLDSLLLQKAMSQGKKKSGADIDIMFGEYDVIDGFWDSVAGDRRFTSKNFDAGVETLTFNGKTMVKDLLAPYNELFMLKKDAINWYVELPMEFADDDGSILKNVAGYDRWEAFMRTYIQIAPTDKAMPASCVAIRDIRTA